MIGFAGPISEAVRLHAPLAGVLLQKRGAYMRAGRDPEGMSITLRTRDWPKQHKAGVARCVGFDIHWVD